mmetsp:Transcript_67387/g.194901  ORF Transcript_67387/g.194901 Transcript_67387/m.194901 type:complete len:229 (+) Transcript_67387:877-1563(+)
MSSSASSSAHSWSLSSHTDDGSNADADARGDTDAGSCGDALPASSPWTRASSSTASKASSATARAVSIVMASRTFSYNLRCAGVNSTMWVISTLGGNSTATSGSPLQRRSTKGLKAFSNFFRASSRLAMPSGLTSASFRFRGLANCISNTRWEPKKPGMAKLKMACNSERRFSTGVPVRAIRAEPTVSFAILRIALEVWLLAFLTTCASSRTIAPNLAPDLTRWSTSR